jgi:hypothetical protein
MLSELHRVRYDTGMRRLTLILSDLYLAEESAPSPVGATDLPALEWLLRVSDKPARIADWRSWLLAQAPGKLAELSVTAACARDFVPGDQLEWAWFATPVNCEARLDHVRMTDRGLLRLGAEERAAACAEFARVFGAGLALYDGGERTFYLTGLAAPEGTTTDPARLLGADIGSALPARAAVKLRQLGAEIEMWLHGSALNQARERARQPRISTLWLWRGAAPSRNVRAATRSSSVFLGGDPLIDALARHGRMTPRGVPDGLSRVAADADHVVAEFAALTGGPHERLTAIEESWFAPAREALVAGALHELELVANDRVFRISPRARWRFWRRPAPWLTRLGDRADAAQA